MKAVVVAGARPNFMKVAPVLRALAERGLDSILVHTGQHYDDSMSQAFFRDLEVREPDQRLGGGSASHAVQKGLVHESLRGGGSVTAATALSRADGNSLQDHAWHVRPPLGPGAVSEIRDVQIEELLRREPVVTDQEACAGLVKGTTVLLTGWSIGSEICRQVVWLGVRELVLLDHGENAMLDIHCELLDRHPEVRLVPSIADIRNRKRVNWIFETYAPQTVFHAAAHKHVPLMEWNPCEAVTNSVGGTMNVLGAA